MRTNRVVCRPIVLGVLLTLTGARALLAQAVLDVYFSNFGPALNEPIYNVDGVSELAGPNFSVELTYDTTPLGSPGLAVASPPLQFTIPNLAGYFGDGTTRQITGFNAGATVTFRVRAWDNENLSLTYDQATVRGISDPFSLTVPTPPAEGQPPAMAQWLYGLESFQMAVVPEGVEITVVFGLGCLTYALLRKLRRQRLPQPFGG